MVEERRNDTGLKVMVSVFTSTLGIILALFINATWTVANEGKNMGIQLKADLMGVEAKYQSISSDLAEIKILLKRTIPLK